MANAEYSVLIVAYRSRETIKRCLDALARQTLQPSRVLLLENGSPEGERLTAEDVPDWVNFVTSDENLGFAAGNNRLASEVNTDWLVLLNPDAFAHPDWLERVDDAVGLYPNASLFGCVQLAAGQDGILDGIGDVYHGFGLAYRSGYGKPLKEPLETGRVFGACGAAMAVRTSTWRELGGLDEGLFCYNEDVDLAYRARLRGWGTIQLADARVDHLGYGSSGRRSKFATYYGVRNRLWVFLRNTPGWAFPLLLPLHFGITLALWLSAARFGHFTLFARAIWAVLRKWPEIMEQRRALQARRTVSVGEILAAMTWNPLALLTRASDIRKL